MLDTYSIVAVFLAFFAGGFVKGIIGLGMPTIALGILASFMGLRESLPLLIVPIILTNLVQVVQGGEAGPVVRRFWLMNVCAFAGVWLGAIVLFSVNPLIMTGVLGVIVCVYSGSLMMSLEMRVDAPAERWLTAPVGLITGVMTGMTGSSVFPLIPYLHSLALDRHTLVRALGFSFLATSVALGLALADHGAMDVSALGISVLALAPSFAGMYAGTRVRVRLSHGAFQKVFLVGLLVLGINLVRKGFF